LQTHTHTPQRQSAGAEGGRERGRRLRPGLVEVERKDTGGAGLGEREADAATDAAGCAFFPSIERTTD
jgi:hypothetical protein